MSDEKNLTTTNSKTKTVIEKKSLAGVIIVVILGVVSFFLFKGTVSAGADAASDKFLNYYSSEKENVYNSYYDKFYDIFESKYHTSNDVTIFLEQVKEIKELEVLKVYDVEYIIENKDDNDYSIIAWLEVPGEGSFVIDLARAEFIKNDSKHYVHVKVPYPELKDIRIDYSNVNKLQFRNNILDDSIKVGEEIARQQLKTADALIKKEFISNKGFYESAQNSARSLLINMIKQLNPDVEDIEIVIDFF